VKWGLQNDQAYRLYNIYNDKYGYGDAFRANVLGPILDAIRSRPDAVWAIDLVNEVEGSVAVWFWSDGWPGARRYLRTTALFTKAAAPGIPVTASAGWGDAAKDILSGKFDDLGLDFYDVHQYTNSPGISKGHDLAGHARAHGMPIVVGEFGQKKKGVDPQLQARIARGVLDDALRLGFAGALSWRLEDRQPDGVRFSSYDGNTPRPIVSEMQRVAALVGP
jgi:hypothetical protein